MTTIGYRTPYRSLQMFNLPFTTSLLQYRGKAVLHAKTGDRQLNSQFQSQPKIPCLDTGGYDSGNVSPELAVKAVVNQAQPYLTA